jgi:malic enzyme
MKAQGTSLKDARVMFYGAGSSAVGVAQSIASYIHLQGGVPQEDADKVLVPALLNMRHPDKTQKAHGLWQPCRARHCSQKSALNLIPLPAQSRP